VSHEQQIYAGIAMNYDLNSPSTDSSYSHLKSTVMN